MSLFVKEKIKNLFALTSKVHFLRSNLISYCQNLLNTLVRCLSSFCCLIDLMIMSSMYTFSDFPISSLKNLIHHPLIRFTYVLQDEGNEVVPIVGTFNHEGGFVYIYFEHRELVVFGV